MTSDPPRSPDSTAKYGALFLGVDDEEEALDALSARDEEIRGTGESLPKTVVPPMPGPEYVQAMMAQAELADPEIPRPPTGPEVPSEAADPFPPIQNLTPSAAFGSTAHRPKPKLPRFDDVPGLPRLARREPAPGPMPPIGHADAPQRTAEERDGWQRGGKPAVLTVTPSRAREEVQLLDELDDLLVEDVGLPPPLPPPTKRAPRQQPVAGPRAQPSFDKGHELSCDETGLGDRPTPIMAEPIPKDESQLREMAARFQAKDYRGAIVLAETILATSPTDVDAKRCAEDCRRHLAEKYMDHLGGPRMVPRVVIGRAEMRSLALDHRAGFLLSSIDGTLSIEEIIDVSCMPALDALRLMFELTEQGAIVLDPPRRLGRH